jgi:hypothetical protein
MPVIVTSAGSSRWHAVPAAAFAALAVWLSSGAIALRNPSGARIGALPLGAVPILGAALVAAIVLAIGSRHSRGAAVAVSPLALLLIPWLPVPLAPAFLIWTGALTVPIWIGVALALASVPFSDSVWHAHSVMPPPRHVRLAFVCGCLVFGLAAWSASAAIPSGDEPHYLVITQSLLHDHDLNVENNYAQGDYRQYYGGPLSPDFRIPGRHGELYSIHAPGVPALVLPAFALGGYRAVVVFLVLVSAAACALAWWLAWRSTDSFAAAWFGWAVVVFAAPFLLESFTVYPDGPGAAIVLTAFWALWRIDAGETPRGKAWLLHGAALAALPWMHTRFALLAVLLGLMIIVRLLRTGNASRIPLFLAGPMVSAAGWIAAAHAMYGTLNPAAAYGGQSDTALAFLPNGVGGLLFDQGFGLIATAPALAVAFAGLVRARRFAMEWGVTAIVYAAAVGSYAMWWAGTSGPARFLVPLLLPLAVPAALAWQAATSRGVRVVMTAAVALTAWMSAVMAAGAGGFLAYHSRNVYGMTPAPWLAWANGLVDLSQALPAFVPLPRGTPLGARMAAARDGFAAAVPWVACFAGALYLTVWFGRRRARLYEVVAASVVGCAAAVMIAASIVWWTHGGHHMEPSTAQLELLRRIAVTRTLTLDVSRAQRIRNLFEMNMRIEFPIEPGAASPATLASIRALPAGVYVLTFRGSLGAPASVYAGQDDEPFAFVHGVSVERLDVNLPVPVRALMVRAPSSAGVSALEMRPYRAGPFALSKDPAYRRVAHHAAAYGHVTVFFLDDRTSPEQDGFWIWGAREGLVMFRPMGKLEVTLRNGPVRNEVTIRAGDQEQHVALEPDEQRSVSLPTANMDAAYIASIRTSAGFRPSDFDPHSQDRRYLGVYVVMPEHAVR